MLLTTWCVQQGKKTSHRQCDCHRSHNITSSPTHRRTLSFQFPQKQILPQPDLVLAGLGRQLAHPPLHLHLQFFHAHGDGIAVAAAHHVEIWRERQNKIITNEDCEAYADSSRRCWDSYCFGICRSNSERTTAARRWRCSGWERLCPRKKRRVSKTKRFFQTVNDRQQNAKLRGRIARRSRLDQQTCD